jgi:hypothetical protein
MTRKAQPAPIKLRKTNSKEYVQAWEAYVADCIDVDGDESPTLKEKLAHAAQRFASEYGYPDNLRRYPNVQNRLKEYLQGLPFSFAFNYSDITETACRLHGVSAITEKQADMIQEQWIDHCALMLLRVAQRHGVAFA